MPSAHETSLSCAWPNPQLFGLGLDATLQVTSSGKPFLTSQATGVPHPQPLITAQNPTPPLSLALIVQRYHVYLHSSSSSFEGENFVLFIHYYNPRAWYRPEISRGADKSMTV